jgi:hypothetical protein
VSFISDAFQVRSDICHRRLGVDLAAALVGGFRALLGFHRLLVKVFHVLVPIHHALWAGQM